MQRNKRFNKKKAVRFQLVPGRDENGNPTTTFKPIQTRTKLSKKERNKIISQISDYQIEIDGKLVHESQIPSFVLEQIKGRSDLVFVQNNPNIVYDEGKDQQMNEDLMMEEVEDQWDEQGGQEIPEQEYMGAMDLPPAQSSKGFDTKKEQQQQLKQIEVDGHKYTLTASQIKQLQEVLPQNYENYKIDGVQFVKYDEYGNRIDQREKYKKYIAESQEKRAIVDFFEFVPSKPTNIVDNDLEEDEIKGDVKQVEDALNFDGDEDAYEQLEDDFFSKLIKGQQQKVNKKEEVNKGQGFKKKKEIGVQQKVKITQKSKNAKNISQPTEIKKQKKASKLDDLEYADYQDQDDGQYEDMEDGEQQQYQDYDDYEDGEQITDEMLDKAIEEFDKKVEKSDKIRREEPLGQTIIGTGIPINMKGMSLIKFIQSRQQCIGKDGQLDWRTLTKKQKKEYMKNKLIRSAFDQAREKEITEKLLNKKNVTEQQLHLKKYIEHIPYSQDHVMQEAIKRDQQQVINLNEPVIDEDFETESDEDDIVSYRAKTSIISSNLATVEEPSKKSRKKSQIPSQKEAIEEVNIEKIKVVPEKRDRKQTAEQRKERKQRLKQLKKKKKEQKHEFNELFEVEKKKMMKKDKSINNNPLHKVAFVKII